MSRGIIRLRPLVTLLVCSVFLCACDSFMQEVGPSKVGIKFSALPGSFGGLKSKIIRSDAFVMPWEHLYILDTKIKRLYHN